MDEKSGHGGDCNLVLGERVVWLNGSRPEEATVKWIGVLPDPGAYAITVGVEFDKPIGTGNGLYKQHRLFNGRQNHSSLIPVLGLVKSDEFYCTDPRGPPPSYEHTEQGGNPAFVSDPYATQYSSPAPTINTSDPYANNFRGKAPPVVNEYGFQVNPGQAGYSNYPGQAAVVVTQPTVTSMITNVPDYMGLALFVTICCCWPLGVMSISKNSEARRHAQNGNIAGAQEAAANAKRLSLWGIFIGIIVIAGSVGLAVGLYLKYRTKYYYMYSSTYYYG